ncbi:VOC family protein [Maricaulis maris]|jgi:catechol 2,3-dioxygenase-like lactoylglutathione lyase family enzyme|uniref:VOC family protein n=1 Tax=Maricaulis maris TaxID=74318 RepID=UPI002922D704|nr:hypothetical protein MACH15_21680 [Maricaulis maris]
MLRLAALTLLLTSLTTQSAAAEAPAGLKTRIDTNEFEAMEQFYRTVLGLAVADAWDENGDRGVIFSVPGGGQIELGDVADAPDPAGLSIQIEVEDVAAEQFRIGTTWPTEGPSERPWGLTYLYLTDPSGVDIILYQPTAPATGEP